MAIKNDWVEHFRQYSLKELRRRQNLAKQQIRIAHRANNNRALTVLHDVEDSLTEAVFLNEFT